MLQSVKSSKILVIILLILISTGTSYSQEWNSARLTILSGSTIPFNFNSLDKFKKGIEISNGTRFGITLADSSKVGHTLEGFVLNFRTFNNQGTIKGDVYTLPLNRIRVKAESIIGFEKGVVFSNGFVNLTPDWSQLLSYKVDLTTVPWKNLNWLNDQLNVAYECGKPISEGGNGTLIGEEPDYYNVEIEFELVPTGPGF
jgi:hypothetical protein